MSDDGITLAPDGAWHHVVVTHDGGDYRLYVDGERVMGWTHDEEAWTREVGPR